MKACNVLAVLSVATLVACAAPADETSDTTEGAASGSSVDSVFTNLGDKDCKPVPATDFDFEGICPGVGAYTIKIIEGDLRQNLLLVRNGRDEDLNLQSQQPTEGGGSLVGVSSIGQKADWRVRKRGRKTTPFALTFRFLTTNDGETFGNQQYLIVAKLAEPQACVFKIIDASKHANANDLARAAANEAETGSCPARILEAN